MPQIRMIMIVVVVALAARNSMAETIVTSAALEHHDGDLAVRARLVAVVVGPLGDHALPQLELLVRTRRAGVRLEAVIEHLDLDLGLGLEVDVPARRLVGPALGGDDHVGVAGRAVDERRGALLTALAALRGEQEDRCAPLPVVTELSPGLAVRPDMLFAEEMGCILSGHATGRTREGRPGIVARRP